MSFFYLVDCLIYVFVSSQTVYSRLLRCKMASPVPATHKRKELSPPPAYHNCPGSLYCMTCVAINEPALASLLKKNGYAVVRTPWACADQRKKLLEEFKESVRNHREFTPAAHEAVFANNGAVAKSTGAHHVCGGFAALGNRSSFHSTTARDHRKLLHIYADGIMKNLCKELGTDYGYLQLIDREMIRPARVFKPTAEAWHRDEAHPDNKEFDGFVFGGWIQYNDKSSYFSCVPGSHKLNSKEFHGFKKISPSESQAYVKARRRVEVPAGHLLIFFENIVHEIDSKSIKETIYRRFAGWAICNRPLYDVRPYLKDQSVVRLKSGQIPPMWPRLYMCNWIDKLVTFTATSLKYDHDKYTYKCESGKNKGKEFVIAHRIQKGGLKDKEVCKDPYPDYTEDEILLYTKPSKTHTVFFGDKVIPLWN